MARTLFFRMVLRKFSEITNNKPIFSQYNIFYNYEYLFFQSAFWSLFNHHRRSQSNQKQCSLYCCPPCFRVLLCTHYRPLQCFSTYFCKLKEIGFLRPIFPDYVISCDYDFDVRRITCLQTLLLSLKQYFNSTNIKYSSLENIGSTFWIFFKSDGQEDCPFSHYCAPLSQATIKTNGIIFDINVSSTGHKITVLSYWLELALDRLVQHRFVTWLTYLFAPFCITVCQKKNDLLN